MLIRSMAGDFEISIKGFEVKNGRLIMVGTMGVWGARPSITPRVVDPVFAKLLRPGILFYILRLPFLVFARKPHEPVPINED